MWRLEFARNCFLCKEEWTKILFSDLVTFEKVGLALALSSMEALSLGASGDGVLADIKGVFSSNLSGRKARTWSGGSQDAILRSLGEFLQAACRLLRPISFRAPQEVVHGSLAAAKLGCDVSA